MTALALRLSGHRNAVSRRHGDVARRMWQGLWPDRPEAEVPGTTNGVPVPSWLAPEIRELCVEHLGPGWLEAHDDPAVWSGITQIPDEALWSAHLRLKRRLLVFLRERARRRWVDERAAPAQVTASGALLDPDVLTLGSARRFATYKRATLILRDPARLRRLLTDPDRPVELGFAGKAHPADEPGKALLRAVYQAALDPAFEGRIAFVEDPRAPARFPWVRLHALRDYYGMAVHAAAYPAVHLTVNFSPVLLEQLEAYADGRATDQALELTGTPTARLSSPARRELVDTSFDAHWHHPGASARGAPGAPRAPAETRAARARRMRTVRLEAGVW